MKALKLHTSNTLEIYSALTDTKLEIPMVSGGISAGFPSLPLTLLTYLLTLISILSNILQLPSTAGKRAFYER